MGPRVGLNEESILQVFAFISVFPEKRRDELLTNKGSFLVQISGKGEIPGRRLRPKDAHHPTRTATLPPDTRNSSTACAMSEGSRPSRDSKLPG